MHACTERALLHCWRKSCAAVAASQIASDLHSLDVNELEGEQQLEVNDGVELLAEFPTPETRYQQPLLPKQRKEQHKIAEKLAVEKRLVRVQVGQHGLTPNVLRSCMDAIVKHGLIRVKLGEGAGLSRREARALLEQYLDCACVHEIGFTVTLYRQKDLHRPSNYPPLSAAAAANQVIVRRQKKHAVKNDTTNASTDYKLPPTVTTL